MTTLRTAGAAGCAGAASAYTFVVFWRPGRIGWWPAGGDDPGAAPVGTGEAPPGSVALTPPLPAVWAEGIVRRLQARRAAVACPDRARALAGRLLHGLASRGLLTANRPYCPPPADHDPWDEGSLVTLTAGRRLLPRDVYRRWLRRRGMTEEERPPGELARLVAALFRLAEGGRGHVVPGVLWEAAGELRCARCGGREMAVWPCARCGQPCPECETCRSLGPVRGCDVLFAGAGTPAAAAAPPAAATSRATGAVAGTLPSLSPAQEGAARALLAFLDAPRAREALVWAACGAGKTEVAFAAIRTVLERGGRVLFAVPRRDVVAELGQRLASYAAPFAVEVAYGGAPPPPPGQGRPSEPVAAVPEVAGVVSRTTEPAPEPAGAAFTMTEPVPEPVGAADDAPLVVATTHQCLRWGPRFHLVVLDEVDAFPYRAEPFLQRALLGTLAPGGKLVTMTATPDPAHLRRARWGGVTLVTIPARYHGHPLPVPRWVRDTGGPDGLGAGARRALAEAAARGPTLAFVPTVARAEEVGAALGRDRALAGVAVDWIHSRDPHREDKLAAFREGRIRILVATTVLERGITVPSAQVVVLFADEGRVFDTAALVQMAGRAGRSAADPDGLVYFVARRRTPAMVRAVGQIRELNRRAARAGYLRPAERPGLRAVR